MTFEAVIYELPKGVFTNHVASQGGGEGHENDHVCPRRGEGGCQMSTCNILLIEIYQILEKLRICYHKKRFFKTGERAFNCLCRKKN